MQSLLTTAVEGGASFEFLNVDPSSIELEPWPLPTLEADGIEIDGQPGRRGRVLWRSPDTKSVLLIEELEPCTFRGRHGGELVYLLAGKVIARPGDGKPEYEMRAGHLGWFEAGLWDEWVVEETCRKFLFAAG
jgi:uncharacterized cupin superfamily protein